MTISTWRGWLAVIAVGVFSALLTFLVCVQVRHWLVDEQQLHEIVALLQSGRIQIAPPASAPAPAAKPPAPPTPKD